MARAVLREEGGLRHYTKANGCDVEGCGGDAVAKNLCNRHYQNLRKGVLLNRRGERVTRGDKPWEWLGDESALAAMTAAQEQQDGHADEVRE
jgi:hypothetical protein